MRRILSYGMTAEKMCFTHILLNALDLSAAGHEAIPKIKDAMSRLKAQNAS